jgi:exopolysaccharide biosynthesis protein
MRHQGLATYYFPDSVVKEVTDREAEGREAQVGDNTVDIFEHDADVHDWMNSGAVEGLAVPDEKVVELEDSDKKDFYLLFYELDLDSTEAWLQAHPEALENGYEHIMINESALGGEGTTIRTRLGEKVLAIDTENQILLLEVNCDGSRGVMAIAKLASRLHLCPASNLPYYGETAGSIAKRNGGVLAMTGSGFIDEGGVGNGGDIAGWAMCGGKSYGEHYGWGYKRMELHENNWFYIKDAFDSVGSETTDAMEFTPALITNGKKLNPGIWTSQNPRACIGQSNRGEILMLCVEGRSLSSPGCSVEICADVLLQHDCITAMNCDGGTTAIMWYRGEPVMRCSNSAIPQGRYLPNAWVYFGE